jgi:cytochrome c553
MVAVAIAAPVLALGIAELSRAQSRASSPQSPSTLVDPQPRGQEPVEAACAGCHGPDGNSPSPQFPKLAGQKAAYLASQLRAYKNGTRTSNLMAGPASNLSGAQIEELATFYSAQTVKPDVVADPELASFGAQIFTRPRPGAPPCAACHTRGGFGPMGPMMGGGRGMMGGMGMMGNLEVVPNLDGQHARYTVQQLDAFASGARTGRVMGPIAASLSERDRVAVAQYLSGLR